MSEPTGPAPTRPAGRPAVVPLGLGLVLVAAVIAAALLIERATDSDLDLPDELAGGYTTAPRSSELTTSAEESLEDVLDAPATVRSYMTSGGERHVTISVVDQAAGPFAPNGPQAAPEELGLERGSVELVRDGDAVCLVAWGAVVAEGEDVPDENPIGVQCQQGADGHTYWLNGRGLTVDDAVEILDDVTGQLQ